MRYLMKFGSEESKMNCDTSMTLKMDADIIVPTEYFQNYQLKKSKRYRSAFTTDQIHYLESEFKKFPYIGSANRKEVANVLKISERAVKIWFQNRRMKEKREVNNNKELIVEDKTSICNAFSNEQLNSRSMYSHNDCSTNELLLSSRCQDEHLKEANIETRNPNCTPNETPNLANQIKVKSVNNINISENQNNNSPMDMTKDTKNPRRFKSSLLQKTRDNKRKIPVVAQKNKHIQQFNDVKEFKSQVKIPIPLLNKKGSYVAKDLSLSNTLIDQKDHQQFYPVHSNTDQRHVPLFTQGYYMPHPLATHNTIHSGNVIWKPVSMMPILPGLTAASTMTIGHNGSGIPLNNQDFTKGTCNCHGPPHIFNTRMQCVARSQPQYILAIPFSNSSSKM